MSDYVMLVNWTAQGVKNVRESPQRLAAARKLIEAAGGKMTGFYLTMGRYDMVIIVEAPNDEAVATVALSLGSAGNIRTETMKAFPEDRYRDIVAKIQ